MTIEGMLLRIRTVFDIVPFINAIDLALARGEIGIAQHREYGRSAWTRLKATELSLRYGGFNRDLMLGSGQPVPRAA